MKVKRKTLRRLILAVACIIILAIAIFIIIPRQSPGQAYTFKDNKAIYSSDRGKPDFVTSINSTNDSIQILNVNFQSRPFMQYPTRIYGLIFLPQGKPAPGVVLLPGGGVSKETESKVAMIIAKAGYAVITIDQRGIGQTGGYYLGLEQDYQVFSNGNEPTQYLSVFDILKTYDVLREIPGVDRDRIALVGESMGGRYALIAASMEKRLKGVVAISSAGFHIDRNNTAAYTPFLLSVDPDNYVADIAPSKLVMIHSMNDTMVKIQDAAYTYSLASQPKQFYSVDNCPHGYCDAMHDYLLGSLNDILGK